MSRNTDICPLDKRGYPMSDCEGVTDRCDAEDIANPVETSECPCSRRACGNPKHEDHSSGQCHQRGRPTSPPRGNAKVVIAHQITMPCSRRAASELLPLAVRPCSSAAPPQPTATTSVNTANHELKSLPRTVIWRPCWSNTVVRWSTTRAMTAYPRVQIVSQTTARPPHESRSARGPEGRSERVFKEAGPDHRRKVAERSTLESKSSSR